MRVLAGLLAAMGLVSWACGAASPSSSAGQGSAVPSGSVIVTLQVAGSETYKILLTEPDDVAIARDLLAGKAAPGIPNGRVVRDGDGGVNAGYGWHIDAADVEWADTTVEVCDGLPSDVEKGIITSDRYCPVELQGGRDRSDLNGRLEPATGRKEMDMGPSTGNVTIREADTIWREEGGWFDARWHFSFDRYRDPEQMGVGALRVFNDDRIVAGAEWPLHPHRDIESLTYVVEGHFLHADSLGNNGHLEPGAAQVMTFSHRGDLHSEKNGSPDEADALHPVLDPAERPGARDARAAAAVPVGGPHRSLAPDHGPGRHGRAGPRAGCASARLAPHRSRQARAHLRSGRGGYLYVIDGRLSLDGESLSDWRRG